MAKAVRNVLFMAFMFPPVAGPSSRHNLSTVRRLREHGWSPTVVTAPEVVATERKLRSIRPSAEHWPQDDYLRSRIPEDVSVVRCPWPFEYRRIFGDISGALRFPVLPYFFRRGRQRMYKAARGALEAGNYDLIYSVNGIGVEHSAALELKRSTGLPWVAEFRDPWIHCTWEWQSIRAKSWLWWCRHRFNKVKAMLHEIVNHADLIIVESPMHAELLINDFDLEPQKVLPLGIGYETDYLSDVKERFIEFPTRPAIGFIGQVLYGQYQDAIRNLIAALRALEREGQQFTLVTVGDPDKTFYKFAKEAKLTNFLPVRSVDYLSAVSIMSKLDFGLVATCQKCFPAINSKLWEYLALNLSILGVIPKAGSMGAIIDAGSCGYVLPYDSESLLLTLRGALSDYEQGKARRAAGDFVQSYSRETIVAQLAEGLDKLLSSRNR